MASICITHNLTIELGSLGTCFKFREEQSIIFAGSEQIQTLGHQNVAADSSINVQNTRKHAANIIIS